MPVSNSGTLRRRLLELFVPGLLLIFVATCDFGFGGGDGDGAYYPPSPCQQVTVSSGASPTFNWTGCEPTVLQVIKLSLPTESIVWDIRGAMDPPVQYGVVPPNAHEVHAAEALVAGTSYKLSLQTFDETGWTILGSSIFTP